MSIDYHSVILTYAYLSMIMKDGVRYWTGGEQSRVCNMNFNVHFHMFTSHLKICNLHFKIPLSELHFKISQRLKYLALRFTSCQFPLHQNVSVTCLEWYVFCDSCIVFFQNPTHDDRAEDIVTWSASLNDLIIKSRTQSEKFSQSYWVIIFTKWSTFSNDQRFLTDIQIINIFRAVFAKFQISPNEFVYHHKSAFTAVTPTHYMSHTSVFCSPLNYHRNYITGNWDYCHLPSFFLFIFPFLIILEFNRYLI